MPDDADAAVTAKAAPSGLTRRSFLAGANALVLVALLEACTGTHHRVAVRELAPLG